MTEVRLHLLVRAVIELRGHLLVAQARGQVHTFLPGGHVEPGEKLTAGLVRELREETGLDFEVGAFLGTYEHAWTDGAGRTHHEITQAFRAQRPDLDPARSLASVEPHLTFRWVPLADLGGAGLLPPPLAAHLNRERPGGWFFTTPPG